MKKGRPAGDLESSFEVSCNDAWQSMCFQLYVQFDHVVDFILDEIRKNAETNGSEMVSLE